MAVFERRGFAYPHHEEQAKKINSFCAALWTELDSIAAPPGSESARLIAMAKTDIETAGMKATKALTRFSPSQHVN